MSATAKSTPLRSTARLSSAEARGARIVHLTSVHPTFDVRIFHKECRSIARAGYDVTLICTHDRDEIVEGVRVKAVSRASGRFFRMFCTTRAILKQAIREDADLYHFHDPELIPAALLLRLRKKKVVYDVHENVPADVSAKHYIPRLLRRPVAWLAGLIEKAASQQFSAVVPATREIAHRFESRTAQAVLVRNYPSVDDISVAPSWSQRSASVVYAGLLSPDRCIKEILQALELIPSAIDARTIFAGPFSPRTYADEIAGMPGQDRAKFLGTIDRFAVSRLYDGGRAGLCLCRPTLGYLESAPTKIFEYMQAGIPVIASDFPAFRAIVNTARCGLLVDPLDPGAIAGAIEYILTHATEAEQMGWRGREAARQTFNWTSEESKLLALYARLLDSHSMASASPRQGNSE
ncbi:MAG TPA: glycosyltransferase family 4 protein [Candidatus Sulfotelmatobacter sp.]|nr:glycosyltransferase family 4 protein [Candidatus Sulfotelmatobacter sp.]